MSSNVPTNISNKYQRNKFVVYHVFNFYSTYQLFMYNLHSFSRKFI